MIADNEAKKIRDIVKRNIKTELLSRNIYDYLKKEAIRFALKDDNNLKIVDNNVDLEIENDFKNISDIETDSDSDSDSDSDKENDLIIDSNSEIEGVLEEENILDTENNGLDNIKIEETNNISMIDKTDNNSLNNENDIAKDIYVYLKQKANEIRKKKIDELKFDAEEAKSIARKLHLEKIEAEKIAEEKNRIYNDALKRIEENKTEEEREKEKEE